MKKILITGGCGFIGSNLIEYLLENKSTQITVFDNQSLGKKEYIADLNVEFIEGDIRHYDQLVRAMINVDAVIHLAADTRVIDSIANPRHNFENNVLGTFNVLSAAQETRVKAVVNASTAGAILGDVPPPVNEEMLPKPIAPYGASKLATEAYCSAFAGAYDLNVVSVRFTNVYGKRSFHKGSVVAHFFKQILNGKNLTIYGDGNQLRDYIYVSDLCDGIYQALSYANQYKGEIFQLGTGIPTTLQSLIEIIQRIVGQDYHFSIHHEDFRKGEVRHTYGDITKAQSLLDYNPQTSLESGLQKTWEWFINNKEKF